MNAERLLYILRTELLQTSIPTIPTVSIPRLANARPWEKALGTVLRRNPPRTRAYGYLPAGVYTGQEYARQLIEKPNTFYYGVMWNKLYRRDLLAGHGIRFRQELFAEDQLFNTEYLRYVRTAVSIPDIGYYYLQCSQSVSHSRVTTADILRLRRRVMGLCKIYLFQKTCV